MCNGAVVVAVATAAEERYRWVYAILSASVAIDAAHGRRTHG
jgi:hypothetical protein